MRHINSCNISDAACHDGELLYCLRGAIHPAYHTAWHHTSSIGEALYR